MEKPFRNDWLMSTGTGPCSTPAVGGVGAVPMKPKVLIVSERSAERESVCVLVGTTGCQWLLAPSIEQTGGLL